LYPFAFLLNWKIKRIGLGFMGFLYTYAYEFLSLLKL